MLLRDLKVVDFINEVDSNSPAPGGGSVSALAASNGLALVRMVGHLSVGKKKFKALDEDIQNEFKSIIESFLGYKETMTELIDKDTEAFNIIMAGFKMPKETDEEKQARKAKILEGTIEAIKVPMNVAEICLEAIKKMDYILQYGNKNTLSDLGVSCLMVYAGLEGALMNVKINIPGLSDQTMIDELTSKLELILSTAKTLKDELLVKVHNKL